jgi:hypothetical protein
MLERTSRGNEKEAEIGDVGFSMTTTTLERGIELGEKDITEIAKVLTKNGVENFLLFRDIPLEKYTKKHRDLKFLPGYLRQLRLIRKKLAALGYQCRNFSVTISQIGHRFDAAEDHLLFRDKNKTLHVPRKMSLFRITLIDADKNEVVLWVVFKTLFPIPAREAPLCPYHPKNPFIGKI